MSLPTDPLDLAAMINRWFHAQHPTPQEPIQQDQAEQGLAEQYEDWLADQSVQAEYQQHLDETKT